MTSIRSMLQTAKRLGCPKDQITSFLQSHYAAQPAQLAFHAAARECDRPNGPVEILLGGARGGAKSHSILAQLALDDCQRQSGLNCLLLRKVGIAARESFEDLRLRVLRHIPHHYNRSRGLVTFPNTNSRIVLGHFRRPSDIDRYIGMSYGILAIEEATQLPAQQHRLLRTCRRTALPGWRPRSYYSSNPGGEGHAYIKQLFVIPWRQGKQNGTRFIPSTFRDNAFLDKGYVDTLNALVGWRRQAWRDGDWDVFSGQYFVNWSYKVHVVKPLYDHVPEFWPEVWLAGDYGVQHPTFFLLLAKDNQSNVYVIDEYYASERLPETHGIFVQGMLDKWKVRKERIHQFPFSTDAWKREADGSTVIDSYERAGWDLDQANQNRLQGASEIQRRLGDPEAGIRPTLYIYENCTSLIETLPRLIHDEHRVEDVKKVDIDEAGEGGDDAYDALRYGLMAVSEPTELLYQPTAVPD